AALVVEVADSSLRLDRRLKAALYARNRLPEYWIVNLVDATLEVARDPRPTPEAPESWRYAVVEVSRASASVSPLGAPGAVVAVSDLLPCRGRRRSQRPPEQPPQLADDAAADGTHPD